MLFLAQSAFAYQASLVDYGYSEILNETKDTTVCKELTITLPNSAVLEKGEGILSINASFLEAKNDSSYVSVSINGGKSKIIWPEDFVCNGTCWARIFLPELKKGNTKINLCAVVGGITKSVSITKNSFVGIYDTPVLSITNSAPEKIFLGERAKMSIIILNSGTKDASVFVQFVHPDTRAKVPISSFDIVEGDSSATTVLKAGDTKTFDYYIKPSIVSSYNLPSASLFFTNVFGEEQFLLSEHPLMSVVEQKQIEISLVVMEEKPFVFKALVKNNTSSAFNGAVILSPQTSLVNPIQEVFVGPNSEKEITFNSKPQEKGNYSFVASIRDGNNVYLSNTIELEVKNEGLPVEIIFAIIGILIGAAIFGWLYFKK